VIHSDRLRLRNWLDTDKDAFAALNADPEVTQDLGGPLDRTQSDAKFDRYVAAFDQYGFCRWALEDSDGQFLGYTGIMPSPPDHPLGPHVEIGWRLMRSAWGCGYATEAAKAALHDAFARVGLREIFAYTDAGNLRSRAVMDRLRLQRDPSRDFTAHYDGVGTWHGLVWVARRENSPHSN